MRDNFRNYKKKWLRTSILFFVVAAIIFFAARWAYSADVTLAWDANSETNLAGYKLHYNTVKAGPPYTTTVDVGNILEYTFVDLDLDAASYWFVATAYSVEGFESGYSNEVTTKPPGAPATLRVKVTVEVHVSQ